MNPAIIRTILEPQRLSTAEAELLILVQVDRLGPGTELRGRFRGPMCPGIETVEIAYPVRALPARAGLLAGRIIILEPNLWSPETPFVYEGTIEIWVDGRQSDAARVAACFKST